MSAFVVWFFCNHPSISNGLARLFLEPLLGSMMRRGLTLPLFGAGIAFFLLRRIRSYLTSVHELQTAFVRSFTRVIHQLVHEVVATEAPRVPTATDLQTAVDKVLDETTTPTSVPKPSFPDISASWIVVPEAALPAACLRCRVAARERGLACDVKLFNEPLPTASDAARTLGVRVGAITNSLIFQVRSQGHILVLCPGDRRVDVRKLARVLDCSKSKLKSASPGSVVAFTGFEAGGVAPFGHTVPPLRTFIDDRVFLNDRVWCGAGVKPAMFACSPEELCVGTGGERVSLATSEPADDVLIVGED
jgi:prolyl-tRNA editing enzyme YbaK/EbsC (Cys-tRNA(Pro) deacylase)